MHEEPESVDIIIKKKARKIAGVVAAIMLVAPNMISIYSIYGATDIQLFSVLWFVWLTQPMVFPPIFILLISIMNFPMHILRFAFVYMIYRYYLGKTTRGRASIVGLISEVWYWLPNLPSMIALIISPTGYYYLILPIPILFLSGLIIMAKIPAPDIYTPWEGFKEEPEWWEKPPEKEEKVERKKLPKEEEKVKKKEPPLPDDEPW